jgi:hypothetical protein
LENLRVQGSPGDGGSRSDPDKIKKKVSPPDFSTTGIPTATQPATDQPIEGDLSKLPIETNVEGGSARETSPTEDDLIAVPAEIPQDPVSLEEAEDADGESLNSLWMKVVDEVRRRRPLIQAWIEMATPLGQTGMEVLIGFPATQQLAMESLLRSNNRKFVEELLTEIAAAPRTIRAELRDDLAPPETAIKSETTLLDGFKNDPLIQKALEIFKAEIEADT